MNRKRFPGFNMAWFILLFSMVVNGCNNAPKSTVEDSPEKGTIHISVDESFKPVIEEQIKVYESSFPQTKIIAHYKTEADCFRDLYLDTVNRMIIVTRGLTQKEARFYDDSLGFSPVSDRIAWDAITVLVNTNSNDTLFTMKRLFDLLTGKLCKKHQLFLMG